MTTKDEAKQLDSVTDRVQENETLDSSKALTAMAALKSKALSGIPDSKQLAKIEISKSDVDILVNELEITDDIADRVLREVIFEGAVGEGESALGVALRRLLHA